MVDSTIFWAFAIMSVVAALNAVLNRSIVYAALSLIVVFLSIAGFFVLNNADFLAMAQVIVYAVGLTIILLFAIMFTGDTPRMERQGPSKVTMVAYTIVVAYVFALLVRAAVFQFNTTPASPQVASQLQQQGSTTLLGQQLFGIYALPFELASVLLLVAMIGAIILAKKSFVETDQQRLGDTHFEIDMASAPTAEASAAKADQDRLGDSVATRTNPEDETREVVGAEK